MHLRLRLAFPPAAPRWAHLLPGAGAGAGERAAARALLPLWPPPASCLVHTPRSRSPTQPPPGQANNALVFPAIGHAASLCAARAISDDVFLVTAEALAGMTSLEEVECGLLFPRFSAIKDVSAKVRAARWRCFVFVFWEGAVTAAVASCCCLAQGSLPSCQCPAPPLARSLWRPWPTSWSPPAWARCRPTLGRWWPLLGFLLVRTRWRDGRPTRGATCLTPALRHPGCERTPGVPGEPRRQALASTAPLPLC